jgi:hypothetical protein
VLRAVLALAALAPPLSSCNYGFQAGSAYDFRTLAIVPFENDTDRLELTQELYEALLQELPRALGVRPAGEDVADAVVQGRISTYAVTAPNYRPDPAGGIPTVIQREVSVVVAVRIVDLRENLVIWESNGVRAAGQFLEAETEDVGRRAAIEVLVQLIVDGAQSTW